MNPELIQGLYLSLLGIGGVFIVLGCLAGVLWLIGRARKKEEFVEEVQEAPRKEAKFSETEILAIAVAIQYYHTAYEGVTEVRGSKGWRGFARGFQVGGYG